MVSPLAFDRGRARALKVVVDRDRIMAVVRHVFAGMNHLDTDENTRRCPGEVAVVFVDQRDEPPLRMADRIVAQFGQQRFPVVAFPFAGADMGMADALEILVGRDNAGVFGPAAPPSAGEFIMSSISGLIACVFALVAVMVPRPVIF